MTAAHVVFDFDGTLVDSLGLFVRAYNGIAARRGFKLMTEASIAELQQLDPPARVKYLKVRWYQLPSLARELKSAWRAELTTLACFPGVPEMLAQIEAQGLRLGVISSNDAETIREFAAGAGLPAIPDVRTSGLFGKHRVLGKYMRHHRVRPQQIIYVGDELRDAQACHKAGVRMIAVTWGADKREHFASCPPAAFAENPAHLAELIAQLAR